MPLSLRRDLSGVMSERGLSYPDILKPLVIRVLADLGTMQHFLFFEGRRLTQQPY